MNVKYVTVTSLKLLSLFIFQLLSKVLKNNNLKSLSFSGTKKAKTITDRSRVL